MSTTSIAQICTLIQNGNNYKQWRVMINAVLLENGIYDLEDLSTQFKKLKVEHYNSDDSTRNIVKLESISKRLIYSSIHYDHFAYVENMTGFEMLGVLETKFGKNGENISRMDKILKLFEWKKGETNIIQYLSTKRTLFTDVNSNPLLVGGVKQILPEEFLVAATIMGLPDDIRKICLSWSNKKLASMEYLEGKLTTTGSSWNPIEINSIKNAETKQESNTKTWRKRIPCPHCNRIGHKEERCWVKHPHLRPNKTNAVEVLAVSKIPEVNAVENSNYFLLDSGSEVHICNNRNLMHDLKEVATPVRTANGLTSDIESQGSIKLPFLHGTINEVLCGANWKNILSISKLVVDYNLVVEFTKESALIKKGK